MKTFLSLSLPALLILPGCFGTETGNPPLSAALTVDAHSSDPDRVAIDVDASDAVVEEAWVSLGELRFIGDDVCDAPDEAMAQVPAFGARDHAGAELVRADLELTERDLCLVQVDLTVATSAPAGAPPELEGASIVLRGRRADDTPFTLVYAPPAQVDVRALSDRFRVDEEMNLGLFLGFDVATWLDGVDLAGASVGMDGRIHIDATDNAALLSTFEGNLARGLELYADEDRDGEPDQPTPLARGDG